MYFHEILAYLSKFEQIDFDKLTLTAFLHQVGAKVNSVPDSVFGADSPDSPDSADSPDQVSLSAARNLPSTCAGG